MEIKIEKYQLIFKQEAKTSRESLRTRTVWFIQLSDGKNTGLGECAPLFGLSKETEEELAEALMDLEEDPQYFIDNIQLLDNIPSLKFALECALLDLQNNGKGILLPSDFTKGKDGIAINGLIWMNTAEHMLQQIDEKLKLGFRCIKLKIGALDFGRELSILQSIRARYNADEITIRVDANGGFTKHDAPNKLKQLAELDLHSIEQPIMAGQWAQMAKLCDNNILPIALDEELIGINKLEDKKLLLDMINPQYLVLKPSLHGGISGCNEWIKLANARNIKWWITSYLESNVGLNAIAQWAYTHQLEGHQGLGTGMLYTNNIESPLYIEGETLWRKC